ncbi:MAG TPA: hypothetical protein VE377_13120 [Candidatus Dormibacteraeota bacterium]|nr:hypothetical protein [Candidatus Dormibacteraeota bacterium]
MSEAEGELDFATPRVIRSRHTRQNFLLLFAALVATLLLFLMTRRDHNHNLVFILLKFIMHDRTDWDVQPVQQRLRQAVFIRSCLASCRG